MIGEGRIFLEMVLLRVDLGATEGLIVCGDQSLPSLERFCTGWMDRRESL